MSCSYSRNRTLRRRWVDEMEEDEYPYSVPEASDRDVSRGLRRSQQHAYGNQYVEQLDPDNFDEFVREHPDNLIAFHSPDCFHCTEELQPRYAEAAERLHRRNSPIRLAAMDVKEFQNFGQEQNIKGYPTIRSYRSRNQFREYEGDRSPDDLIRFAERGSGSWSRSGSNRPESRRNSTQRRPFLDFR